MECTNALIEKQDQLVKQQSDIVSLRTKHRKCDVVLTENQDKLVKNQAVIKRGTKRIENEN